MPKSTSVWPFNTYKASLLFLLTVTQGRHCPSPLLPPPLSPGQLPSTSPSMRPTFSSHIQVRLCGARLPWPSCDLTRHRWQEFTPWVAGQYFMVYKYHIFFIRASANVNRLVDINLVLSQPNMRQLSPEFSPCSPFKLQLGYCHEAEKGPCSYISASFCWAAAWLRASICSGGQLPIGATAQYWSLVTEARVSPKLPTFTSQAPLRQLWKHTPGLLLTYNVWTLSGRDPV